MNIWTWVIGALPGIIVGLFVGWNLRVLAGG